MILGAGAASLALTAFPTRNVRAQSTKPLRFLVVAGPGGPADTFARVLTERLTDLQRPVVVENRPGASGVVALEAVARSDPEEAIGTIGSTQAAAETLYPKKSYQAMRDFYPIVNCVWASNVLIVTPGIAKNVQEFIAYLRAHNGRTNYASGSHGSPAHFAAELFRHRLKVESTHIPYKGAAPGVQAVMVGETNFMFASMSAAIPQIRAGRVIGLAVAAAQRSTFLPDLPTLTESGVEGVELQDWFGIVGPRLMPDTLASDINAKVNAAIALPDVQAKLRGAFLEPARANSVADFRKFLEAEIVKWQAIVNTTGIKVE